MARDFFSAANSLHYRDLDIDTEEGSMSIERKPLKAVARRRRAHKGPFPHEGGCDGCERARICNGCGDGVSAATRCTNGRCPKCDATYCTAAKTHGDGGHAFWRSGTFPAETSEVEVVEPDRETGDCYADVYGTTTFLREAMGADESEIVVCHGYPRLQRAPFERFGHAWVEWRGLCFDKRTTELSPTLAISRVTYYSVGEIEAEHVRRYALTDWRAEVVGSGTYGPWADAHPYPVVLFAARAPKRAKGCKS
jgi:hypothetical protein